MEDKRRTQRHITTIERNESVIGESIERMLERLREGEGEGVIEDRDLVYNDNMSDTINPITNIRSDKMEMLLEQKIDEHEYNRKKMQIAKDEKKKKAEEGRTKTEVTGTEGNEPSPAE